MGLFATLTEVVEIYRTALEKDGGSRHALKRFDDRVRAAPESAKAEAAVYDFLNHRHMRPVPFEDMTSGGPDFACQAGDTQFVVEVTALGEQAVTASSGQTNEPQVDFLNLEGFVKLLRSRFSDKSRSPQARKYSGPRVLAIAAQHIAANVLFPFGVQSFVRAVMPSAEAGGRVTKDQARGVEATSDSDQQLIRAIRRAYALIIFFHIGGDDCFVAGAIQPNPEYPLDIDTFPDVPFARLLPVSDHSENDIEWVAYEPAPYVHRFLPAALRRIPQRSP